MGAEVHALYSYEIAGTTSGGYLGTKDGAPTKFHQLPYLGFQPQWQPLTFWQLVSTLQGALIR